MTIGSAIIGSGNIGTDLMFKIKRLSADLHVSALVGIDPESDGLARAGRMGIATTAGGLTGLVQMDEFSDVRVLFDATSAGAHKQNARIAAEHGKVMIDLTPAALGPYVVPAVNLSTHQQADNINMVTCGGQATIPIVAAVSHVVPVAYAEIVASIASKSAGPGTRANIDEFTETTAHALEKVGGAGSAKAIIVLNPASPPVTMRDTVICLIDESEMVSEDSISASVERMVADVNAYVPGYRLKQAVQFETVAVPYLPALGRAFSGVKVTVFLEISGAGHYLPEYAGNLDIMTSAALRAAEGLAGARGWLNA